MTGSLPLVPVLAGFVLGYALGSIPFGLLLTRAAGLGDVRTIGSGNIGATNVLRTGRRDIAAATLLLDGLKGTAALLLAAWLLGREAALAAAVGAFLGHCFPVWLGFKGGKGIATYLGILLALDWRAALAFAAVWLGMAALTRYSSAAALAASAAAPLALLAGGDRTGAAVVALLAAVAWAKHHENIRRLLAGQESRIGGRS